MSTQASFVEYVAEQVGLGPRLTAKRMFGEYGLYIDGKVVAFACDDSLFVKPADATAALCADLPRRPPYPGAKPYPVADELLDDGEALRALLLATFAAVGEGKAQHAKKPPANVATVSSQKTSATGKAPASKKPSATAAAIATKKTSATPKAPASRKAPANARASASKKAAVPSAAEPAPPAKPRRVSRPS